MKENFIGKLSKLGSTVLIILNDLLELKVGDKIPTVDEFTKNHNFSRGTYFNALIMIEDKGLIELEKKGQQGTIIKKINYLKIWLYLGYDNLTIVMAYPGNDSLKRIASAINSFSDRDDIKIFLVFARGSIKRFLALNHNVADLAIQSMLSIERTEIKKDYQVLFEFKKEIHNENVQAFVRKGELEKIRNQKKIKILYDESSSDIKILAKELFKNKEVELINHSYTQSFELLKEQKVDVVIHSEATEDVMKKFQIENYTFNDVHSQELLSKASMISVICKRNKPSIVNVIKEIIDKEQLINSIEALKSGKMNENY